MKRILIILSVILFTAAAILGYKIISVAKQNQVRKMDYAEIHHFKYGMFSVNEWKHRITNIVSTEIDNLTLTKDNENIVKKQLQTQLGILIDKVIKKIRDTHYNENTAAGQIKLGIFNSVIDPKTVKAGIPEYTDAILAEIKKSKNQEEIKTVLKEKIDYYIGKTFDAIDDTARQNIMKRTGTTTYEDAKARLDVQISDNYVKIRTMSFTLMVIAVLIFVFEGLRKGPMDQLSYFILTLTLLVLLAAGVTTPMIDMEAKITSFKFILLGHPIEFTDQVLYFQSKSIQDVFWIMITHKDIEMKAVGILMVCFSIVFPVFKLLSSLAYYYDYCSARKYKLIQFFVMKSGKWSMADVLVVAIFMAYIGFNGIINSQMEDLRQATETVNVITTNGTNLQPGFYLFMTYTILAMFLSGFLKTRSYCPPPSE